MIQKIAASFLLLSASVVASDSDVSDSKRNWTKSFTLKNGEQITHTPSKVSLGFMSSGSGVNLNAPSYNGMALKAPLKALTDMSEAEFVAALRASGLLKE